MRALLLPRLAILSALAFPAARPALGAEEDVAKAEAAATAKVRAALPEPLEDKGLAVEWVGDLVIAGEAAGKVTWSIDVGEYRGKPAWLVSEETDREWAGSALHLSTSLYLARDLTLLRGEWTRDEGDRRLHVAFVRKADDPGSLDVVRRIETAKGTDTATATIPVAADATFGDAALWLFLRHAPKEKAAYRIPVATIDAVMPKTEEHLSAADAAPVRLEVQGDATWSGTPPARRTWAARFARSVREATFHLSPADRSMIAFEVTRPPGQKVVPKGEGGAKKAHSDDAPATTWRAAFLKFGHGYHMAKRPLLEASCHWPSIHAYDVAAGSWSKEKDVAAIQEAYVTEWLARSKHRRRAEADWLLSMTLETGTERTLADGTVVLQTHPEFGGNAFRFRAIDGVWYIVGVDQ